MYRSFFAHGEKVITLEKEFCRNIGRVGCCSGLQVLDSVLKQADTAMYEQKKLHKRLRSE